MERFIVFVFMLVLSIGSSAWHSFVGMTLWGWFVVRQFDVAPLTFWMTWGILLTFSAFRGYGLSTADFKAINAENEAGFNVSEQIVRIWTMFLIGLLALFMGWILTHLI
jgi:hypothetical protein